MLAKEVQFASLVKWAIALAIGSLVLVAVIALKSHVDGVNQAAAEKRAQIAAESTSSILAPPITAPPSKSATSGVFSSAEQASVITPNPARINPVR